jgi:type II secretory pathway pseudopilin PulG
MQAAVEAAVPLGAAAQQRPQVQQRLQLPLLLLQGLAAQILLLKLVRAAVAMLSSLIAAALPVASGRQAAAGAAAEHALAATKHAQQQAAAARMQQIQKHQLGAARLLAVEQLHTPRCQRQWLCRPRSGRHCMLGMPVLRMRCSRRSVQKLATKRASWSSAWRASR